MRLDSRPEYHRAIIKAAPEGFKAYSTGGQRSSRVASLSGANGLVILPQKTSEKERLEKGEKAQAMVVSEIQML